MSTTEPMSRPETRTPGDVEREPDEAVAAPDHRRRFWSPRRIVVLVVVVALVAAATVAAIRILSDETDTRRSLASIETPDGDFTIADAELGERIPAGCDDPGTASCIAAEPGFQILKVTLHGPADSNVVDGILDDPSVFVTADGGDRDEVAATGFSFGDDSEEEEYFVVFTPQQGETQFTLHWPDNEPIELDIQDEE
jgi:hypothetical protein